MNPATQEESTSTFTKYLTKKRRVDFTKLQKEIQELQKFHNPRTDVSEIDKIAYGL